MIKIFVINTAKEMLDQLYKRFLSLYSSKESGTDIQIVGLDSLSLTDSLLSGEASIVVFDSSLMLEILEKEWQEKNRTEQKLVQEFSVFAQTPMVLAMRPELAISLGYPSQNIGWDDIRKKLENEKIQLAYAGENSTSGILTRHQMLYASVEKEKSITTTNIQNVEAQNFLKSLQQAVHHYGLSDYEVIGLGIQNGQWQIDAMNVQESVIFQTLPDMLEKICVVFPKEGVLWADYCLALKLNHGLTEQEMETYLSFRDYLLSSDAQTFVSRFGFRSYIPYTQQSASELDSRRTEHTFKLLERPTADIYLSARSAFLQSKKRTSILLVSDVSGSMEGGKIEQARDGMLNFVRSIENDDERVGVISFANSVNQIVPIGALKSTRSTIEIEIKKLHARGGTALYDAILVAHDILLTEYVPNRIHAIVVMTDGCEGGSRNTSLDNLEKKLQTANQEGREIIVFCIAYGDDAAMDILARIAGASGGSCVVGTLDNIKVVYRSISQFM